jgi:hypothetical protein
MTTGPFTTSRVGLTATALNTMYELTDSSEDTLVRRLV